jgi:nucleotide-binding universal stress UspA family protein
MTPGHPSVPVRILVAAVPHEDDRAVVDYAGALAGSLGAALILVAVAAVMPVETPAMSGFEAIDLETQHEEQALVDRMARERLGELASTLPPGVATEPVLTWGPLGPATVEAARDHGADLVVVAMRVRDHELGHVLHDHADRHVLHHCPVPVLVVPTTS